MKKRNKVIFASITLGLMGGGFLTGVIVPHLKKSTNIKNNINVENNNENINTSNQKDNVTDNSNNQNGLISSNIEFNLLLEEVQTQINKLKVYQNYYKNKLNNFKRTRNKDELIVLNTEVNKWFQDHNGVELHVAMDNLNKDTTYDIFNEVKLLNDDLKEKDNVEIIFNVVLEKIIAKENIVKKLEPFKENIITLNNRYVRERISTNNSSFVNKWNTILHSSIKDLENNLNKQINYDYESLTLKEKYNKYIEWHNQLTEFRTWTLNEEIANELYRDNFDRDWRIGEHNKKNFEYLINHQGDQPKNYKEENAQKMFNRMFETYSIYFSPMNVLFVESSNYGHFNNFDLTKNTIDNLKNSYNYVKDFLKSHNNTLSNILDFFFIHHQNNRLGTTIDTQWEEKENIKYVHNYMSQLNTFLTSLKLKQNVVTILFNEDSKLVSNWFSDLSINFYLLPFKGITFEPGDLAYSTYVPYNINKWSFHTLYKFNKLISFFISELQDKNDSMFIEFINKYYNKIQEYIKTNNITQEELYSKKDELVSKYFEEISNEDISNFRPTIKKIMTKWFERTKLYKIVDGQVTKLLRLKNHLLGLEHSKTFLNIFKPLNDLIYTFWDNIKLEESSFKNNTIIFQNNIIQQWEIFINNIDSLDASLKEEFLIPFSSKKILIESNLFNEYLKNQPVDMELVKNWFNEVYYLNNFYFKMPYEIENQGKYLNTTSKQDDLYEILTNQEINTNSKLKDHFYIYKWLFYPHNDDNPYSNIGNIIFNHTLSSKFYEFVDKKRLGIAVNKFRKVPLLGMLSESLVNEIFKTMSDPTFINDSQRFEELIKKILIDINTSLNNGFYKLLEYDINRGLFFEKYKNMNDDQKQNDSFYNKTMDIFNNWNSKSEQEIKNFFIEYLQNFQ